MNNLTRGNTGEERIVANYNQVKNRYGLSRDFLMKLFKNGTVRSIKIAPAQSSQRLFRIADIETFLLKNETREEVAK